MGTILHWLIWRESGWSHNLWGICWFVSGPCDLICHELTLHKGAGSVMLHAMAYGGANGTSLFKGVWCTNLLLWETVANPLQIIAASPYLPGQHAYFDATPTQIYDDFVSLSGCRDSPSTFWCLVSVPSETLQNASYTISADGKYGQWAFLPVTDFSLVSERPSIQLPSKKVNGVRALIGVGVSCSFSIR